MPAGAMQGLLCTWADHSHHGNQVSFLSQLDWLYRIPDEHLKKLPGTKLKSSQGGLEW